MTDLIAQRRQALLVSITLETAAETIRILSAKIERLTGEVMAPHQPDAIMMVRQSYIMGLPPAARPPWFEEPKKEAV